MPKRLVKSIRNTFSYFTQLMKTCKSALMMMLIVGGLIANSQTININEGLVASYPFNGNASDESGNGNHGFVNGPVLCADRFGNEQSAYYFDGIDDEIIVGNSSNLNPSAITIAFWIMPQELTCFDTFITKGGNAQYSGQTSQYTLYYCSLLRYLSIDYYYSNYQYFSNSPLNTDTWQFVVMTHSGTTVKFYINGNLDNEITNASPMANPTAQDLYIGTEENHRSDLFYHGIMDDIRIYNRALAQEEVTALYQMISDTILLKQGWNLISFDVIPDHDSVQSVFASIINTGNLISVTGFQNQTGVFYNPNGAKFLNTLHNLVPGEGYWVKVTAEDTLVLSGQPFSLDFTYDLTIGWNLIGNWHIEQQNPENAFATLIADSILQMVTGYEQGGLFFNPLTPNVNTLSEIKNSFGYWVKVSENYENFTYGSNLWNCGDVLADIRDGQTYKTIQIGNQCWFGENLNFGEMIVTTENLQSNNDVAEKYCYNNDTSLCEIYGGLYYWGELMNYSPSSSSNPSGVQGLCPTGWHVPSDAEWCELFTFLDGTVDCSYFSGLTGTTVGGSIKEPGTAHWSPPNTTTITESGFDALPGGGFTPFGNNFYELSLGCHFFSSTQSSLTGEYEHNFYYDTEQLYHGYTWMNGYACSLRCVKD